MINYFLKIDDFVIPIRDHTYVNIKGEQYYYSNHNEPLNSMGNKYGNIQ